MALPVPGAGQKGLLSFRLFGFPVTIHTSFVVVILLLGLQGGLTNALVWVAVVTVSVIAHELGHAIVARPTSAVRPRIDLYMMAGLTTWHPGRASRGRRVAVSLAGVGAGVLLGLALLAAFFIVDPPKPSLLRDAFFIAVVINLGWGLVNLLPMLPLDGGQVVLALMPGKDDLAKLRRTTYVSLAVTVPLLLGAFAIQDLWIALLVVFFSAGNIQRLVAMRKGTDPAVSAIDEADAALQEWQPEEALRRLPNDARVPEALRGYAATVRAVALLRLGRPREAQAALLDLPAGSVDPVLEGTVLLANGQEQLARERLATALQGDPPAWSVRELVLLLRAREDDIVAVVGGVTGQAAVGVMDALYHTGDYAAAAAWGERALATGMTEPMVAYNAACAYGRAGDAERALRMLAYAAELGWSDAEQAAGDGDLAAARALPAWPEVHARMGGNPGSRAAYDAG